MKFHVFGFALLTAIAIVASAPAQAQNGPLTRSFVSSAGSDGNPCTITQPCATFAHAYTAIGANGIIAALDPGKYGPITISGPVTINGNGWAAITAPAQGAGVTIFGDSGNVTLNGLEIDGAGAANYGIIDYFYYNHNLIVSNCLLQNFVGNDQLGAGSGLAIQAEATGPANITVANTTFSYNGSAGIYYTGASNGPNLNFIIDHVMATANGWGIQIDASESTGGSVLVAVSNSVLDNNGNGIALFGGNPTMEMMVSDSHIDSNTTAGVQLGRASTILRNVTINQTPNPIILDGNATIWLSQVTLAIVPGFSNNGGIIAGNTSNNTVYSDGTSHFGLTQVNVTTWGFQ